MPLCFIEPQDAIRVIAESVGREARRQLLGEIVRAWVDEIPEQELASHYAKAVAAGDWLSVGRAVVALLDPGIAQRRIAADGPWAREARVWLDELLAGVRR